jgi:hypothetical protein
MMMARFRNLYFDYMETNDDTLKYVHLLFHKLIEDGKNEIINDSDRLRIAAPQYLIETFHQSCQAAYGYKPKPGTPIDFTYNGVLFVPTYLNEAAIFDIFGYLYNDRKTIIKIQFMPAMFREQESYTEIIVHLAPLIGKYFKQNQADNNN